MYLYEEDFISKYFNKSILTVLNEKHIIKIAQELNLKEKQVVATAILLEDDATIPFIARYRKEVTGSLDEVEITAIRDRIRAAYQSSIKDGKQY